MSNDLVGVQSVLVIDADEGARREVRRELSLSGAPIEVTEAADADDGAGLRLLEARLFDCLLLDPPASGADAAWLLARMRERGLGTPVIILADRLDAQGAVELMKAGAIDYLPKAALEPERLWRRVRQAIRIARAEADARAARQAQGQT
jgi:DNA-binding NtrC family response regulator